MEVGPMPADSETPAERRRRLAIGRRRRYREARRDQLRDISQLRRDADNTAYEQQRSQRRRAEGTHELNQQQRSQRRRAEGTHELDQRQRSQRRRAEGTHELDQRQRSQRRRAGGTHADIHLRNSHSFSEPARTRQNMHPFVDAVSA